MKLPANGSVLFTVKDKDKQQALALANVLPRSAIGSLRLRAQPNFK